MSPNARQSNASSVLHLGARHDDADSRVARIVAVDSDGNLELEVLPGTVESHLDLLAQA